jgi:hypothetical protein
MTELTPKQIADNIFYSINLAPGIYVPGTFSNFGQWLEPAIRPQVLGIVEELITVQERQVG